jgi:hypothetical protein
VYVVSVEVGPVRVHPVRILVREVNQDGSLGPFMRRWLRPNLVEGFMTFLRWRKVLDMALEQMILLSAWQLDSLPELEYMVARSYKCMSRRSSALLVAVLFSLCASLRLVLQSLIEGGMRKIG